MPVRASPVRTTKVALTHPLALGRWEEVVARRSTIEGADTGLFAAQSLPARTRIDYYGVRLTRAEYDQQDDQQYCVAIHGKPPYEIIDANPRWNEAWTPAQTVQPKVVGLPSRTRAEISRSRRLLLTAGRITQVPMLLKSTRLPANLMIGGMVNEPVRPHAAA